MSQHTSFPSRLAKYKADTSYIADCLTKIARQYGFFSRKLTCNQPSPNQYELALNEFVPLARYIEKHESTISYLPPAFFERLDQCISRRTSTNLRHVASSRSDAAKQSDRSHGHVINILKSVKYILRKQEELARKGQVTYQAEQMQSVPGRSHPIPMSQGEQLINDSEGYLTMLNCLLDDFQELRDYVIRLWGRYKTGELDLVTVSLATDRALDLAKELEDELIKDLGSNDRVESMIGTLYAVHCQACGTDPKLSPSEMRLPEEMYGVLDHLLYAMRAILSSFMQATPLEGLMAYKENYHGSRDQFGLYYDLTPSQKFHLDKLTLLEALPHFNLLAKVGSLSLWSDRITTSLVEILETRKLTVTSTLAARLFLDIHHGLGPQLGQGFQELTTATKVLVDSVNRFLSYQSRHPCKSWLPEGPGTCQHLLRRMLDLSGPSDWQKSVPVHRNDLQLAETLIHQTKFLFEHHPVGCGVRLGLARFDFLRAGVAFMNSSMAAVSSAHLYNALRNAGRLPADWRDLDLVIERHKSGLFVGEAPSTVKEALNQFSLIVSNSSQLPVRPTSTDSAYGQLGTLIPETTNFIRAYYGIGDKNSDTSYIIFSFGKVPFEERSLSVDLLSKLARFCEGIFKERYDFHMDYFELQLSCLMMLRMIKISVRKMLIESYPDVWADQEHLPLISLLIFQMLANSQHHGSVEAEQAISQVLSAINNTTKTAVATEKCLFGELATRRLHK